MQLHDAQIDVEVCVETLGEDQAGVVENSIEFIVVLRLGMGNRIPDLTNATSVQAFEYDDVRGWIDDLEARDDVQVWITFLGTEARHNVGFTSMQIIALTSIICTSIERPGRRFVADYRDRAPRR